MPEIVVRPSSDIDQSWKEEVLREHWGSFKVVTRGREHNASTLPAYIAEMDGERVGLLTYAIYGYECEVVTMNSLRQGFGIGTELLLKLKELAEENKCRGIWLITTNDNMSAMKFYQKKGFYLVAVHRDAVKQARRLKPEIPEIGNDGIPIRDEIELVMPL
ncbi:GNAT family N-acetyltransferase [bacterium]|nr:GNAT family N-acetyltransferase [bacterium]